ncbi:MAG: CotH kinase family protein, partial [Clostridia bacterium]|nr:CotH kinase family protein [Clostridia bacterium]
TSISTVGIRPKGNSSLRMTAKNNPDDRVSFKVEFDHYIDGQTFNNLDKLILNNMVSDATSLKEYMSFDLMRFMGLDTPYFGYANIYVNGKYWGLYFALEAYDDSYAQRMFGNDHGQLYNVRMGFGGDRGNPQNKEQQRKQTGFNSSGNFRPDQFNSSGKISPPMQGGGMMGSSSKGGDLVYTDDNPDSYSEILDNAVFEQDQGQKNRLIAALKALNSGQDLEKYWDVDEILRYLAAHTFLCNFDSYSSAMHQNYYLYEKGGRITILPWDYNLAYGGMGQNASSTVNFPIDTPISQVEMTERPLISQLLAVPEYLEIYHQYFQKILEDYFQSGYFAQKAAQMDELISPYLQIDPTAFYTYTEHQTAVDTFLKFNDLRVQSIQGQLAGTIPSTTEGQKSNPSALIDCSNLKLSDMGTQGGDKDGGMIPPGLKNMNNSKSSLSSSGIAGKAGITPPSPGNFSGNALNSGGRFKPRAGEPPREENPSSSSSWPVGLSALAVTVIALVLVYKFKRKK